MREPNIPQAEQAERAVLGVYFLRPPLHCQLSPLRDSLRATSIIPSSGPYLPVSKTLPERV